LFIDTLSGPILDMPKRAMGSMGKVKFEPVIDPARRASMTSPQQLAQSLWNGIQAGYARQATVQRDAEMRLNAYRFLASLPDSEWLLSAWRWQLPLWTEDDRKLIAALAARGFIEGKDYNAPSREIGAQ
jgi:hypothetical protein